MGHTPRVMSAEWGLPEVGFTTFGCRPRFDLVEKMLATKGAYNRWVASIPEHIAAAEVVIKKEQEAKEEARQLRDREVAEALLIKDEAVPIEDLDLTAAPDTTRSSVPESIPSRPYCAQADPKSKQGL